MIRHTAATACLALLVCACAARGVRPASDPVADALAQAPRRHLEGRWEESARALEAAAARARDADDARLPGVERELARVLVELGRRDAAQGERALALARGLEPRLQGDPVGLADVLMLQARVHYWRKLVGNTGDWPVALIERALALRSAAGDVRGQSEARFYQGLVAQFSGRLPEARAHFDAALGLARAAGDDVGQGYALRHLADLEERDGRFAQALALHQEALAARERAGWRPGVLFQHLAVGDVLCGALRDCARAEPHYAEALRLADALDEPAGRQGAHMGLGRAAWARRDAVAARPHLEAAVAGARALDDPEYEALAALPLAEVLVAQQEPARARAVLEAARESLRRAGITGPQADVDAALAKLPMRR